jgi:hypothetical protein
MTYTKIRNLMVHISNMCDPCYSVIITQNTANHLVLDSMVTKHPFTTTVKIGGARFFRQTESENFGVFEKIDPDLWNLTSVYINDEHQKKGLGTKLIDTFKSLKQPSTIALWAIDGSEKFYTKLGFKTAINEKLDKEGKSSDGYMVWKKNKIINNNFN